MASTAKQESVGQSQPIRASTKHGPANWDTDRLKDTPSYAGQPRQWAEMRDTWEQWLMSSRFQVRTSQRFFRGVDYERDLWLKVQVEKTWRKWHFFVDFSAIQFPVLFIVEWLELVLCCQSDKWFLGPLLWASVADRWRRSSNRCAKADALRTSHQCSVRYSLTSRISR